MSIRTEMAPYLAEYEAKFSSRGETRWLPHLLFFHAANHRSKVVNTDSLGFRLATARGKSYSPAGLGSSQKVRLVAGSSTVFGIGASSDDWTLASRLNEHDHREGTWLNFGGRSFNSTQELLLLTLYRHLLPDVEEIVIFSGFNNLSLARLPESADEDHGTFFEYRKIKEMLRTPEPRDLLSRFTAKRGRLVEPPDRSVPPLDEQIHYAAELTLRHLESWKILADAWGAKVTYILQPLSGWVRDKGSHEEEMIFAELEEMGGFVAMYGDILDPAVNDQYSTLLAQGAEELGVDYVNFSPVLRSAITPEDWVYIDRIHFTDRGHDLSAEQILKIVTRRDPS